MKAKLFLIVGFAVIFGMINAANAGWVATIKATGQNLSEVKESDITIGTSLLVSTADAAPEPPKYSVNMAIYTPDWSNRYSKDIRKDGQKIYRWIIEVNPCGNIDPIITRTSTLSWSPLQLGPGQFRLREGYTDTGAIAVSDMKAINTYQVSGDAKKYFIVEYTPGPEEYDLTDLIGVLQILTGLKPSGVTVNTDGNPVIGLPDAIGILQKVAGW